MSFGLNQFRIKSRIYAGFGILIVLGTALGLFGVWQQSKVDKQVALLVSMFEGSSANLEIGHGLETLRRAALHYQQFGDDSSATDFDVAQKGAAAQVQKLLKSAASEQRRQNAQSLQSGLASFRGNFDDLLKVGQVNASVSVNLVKIGGQLVGALANVTKLARDANDLATSLAVSRLEVAFYEMRLESTRYSLYRDATSLAGARAATEQATKALTDAEPQLQEKGLGAPVAAIKAVLGEYTKTFELRVDAVTKGDLLYNKTMVPQIIAMQQQVDTVRAQLADDFDKQQDATGDLLASTSTAQIAFVVAALVIGLSFAWLMATGRWKSRRGTARTRSRGWPVPSISSSRTWSKPMSWPRRNAPSRARRKCGRRRSRASSARSTNRCNRCWAPSARRHRS
jgi:hypothetical protein